MIPEDFFAALLAASRHVDAAGLHSLPGYGDRRRASSLLAALRRHLQPLSSLSTEEQDAFVRALARYEDAVGGLGSVTTLSVAFSLIADPEKRTLDWVLRNTQSYAYFSMGAKSAIEFPTLTRESAIRKAERRDANAAKERARAAAAKDARAKRATRHLFAAVRRRDANAVRSLLAQGADPDALSPDGVRIKDYAQSLGDDVLVNLLGRRCVE